jgi:hypothetical protein
MTALCFFGGEQGITKRLFKIEQILWQNCSTPNPLPSQLWFQLLFSGGRRVSPLFCQDGQILFFPPP